MSSAGRPRPGFPTEWDTLELAIRRLLDDYQALRRRAAAAEHRVRELEAALAQLGSGAVDPLALQARTDQLEAENRVLRGRLDDAAERVRRLLARTHFLEEER